MPSIIDITEFNKSYFSKVINIFDMGRYTLKLPVPQGFSKGYNNLYIDIVTSGDLSDCEIVLSVRSSVPNGEDTIEKPTVLKRLYDDSKDATGDILINTSNLNDTYEFLDKALHTLSFSFSTNSGGTPSGSAYLIIRAQ